MAVERPLASARVEDRVHWLPRSPAGGVLSIMPPDCADHL